VRKPQIVKLRRQASVPRLHTFRITHTGLQAFSRTLGLGGQVRKTPSTRRLSIGVPELDRMLGGRFPKAVSWSAGSSGTGKSVMNVSCELRILIVTPEGVPSSNFRVAQNVHANVQYHRS
jgi:hypothetical protein